MLTHLSGIFSAWAILSIVGVGLSVLARLRPLQEWFARSAIISIVLVLVLPLIGHVWDQLINAASSLDLGPLPELPVSGPVVLIVIGHIALLTFLIRRRLQSTRHGAANAADDIEHARTRRRERLSPDDEDLDP